MRPNMLNDGFIKIHRKMRKWEWANKPNTFAVFIHLLMRANIAPSKYQGYDLQAGDLVFGRKTFSEQTGISERKIRTALEHLKTTNEVTIKTTNKFSIISIVKWEEYQFTDQHLRQQPTTEEEYNIYNNNITAIDSNLLSKTYTADFEKFWAVYPTGRKGSKEKSFKAWQKALREKRGSVDDIYQGAVAYSQSSEGRGKFVKGCAAWLNDDRWTNHYQREEQPKDYEAPADIFSSDRSFDEIKKEAEEWSPF